MATFTGTTGNDSLVGGNCNDAVVTVDKLSLLAVVSGNAGLVAGDFFLFSDGGAPPRTWGPLDLGLQCRAQGSSD